MYTAYVLTDESRSQLLEMFPPKYDRVIAHHVTERFGVCRGYPMPEPAQLVVVGYVDSGDGIEAVVVSVNGSTVRPDGNTYHVTLSIDSTTSYKPVDSNTLIKNHPLLGVAGFLLVGVPRFCV